MNKYKHIYDAVVYFIHNKGTKHKKKHGNWILVHVKNNQLIMLDTWNGHITKGHCRGLIEDDGYPDCNKNYTKHSAIDERNCDLETGIEFYKDLLLIP